MKMRKSSLVLTHLHICSLAAPIFITDGFVHFSVFHGKNRPFYRLHTYVACTGTLTRRLIEFLVAVKLSNEACHSIFISI
jgi:hypothetical protein